MAEMSEHTPTPKLCPKCGERQPDTQDWFGKAVHLKVINGKLLQALKAVEWHRMSAKWNAKTTDVCPACGETEADGHAPECQLDDAIAKAEGEGG